MNEVFSLQNCALKNEVASPWNCAPPNEVRSPWNCAPKNWVIRTAGAASPGGVRLVVRRGSVSLLLAPLVLPYSVVEIGRRDVHVLRCGGQDFEREPWRNNGAGKSQ